MITPTQMRAARAMLDISQGVVAEHLGIAANTLSKIESGQSDVSMSRNAEIQKFYEREGIAFTENDGVKWNTSSVVTYEGKTGFIEFIDDVYETVKSGNQDICISNVDEKDFLKWGKDIVDDHIERMSKIPNLSTKILVKEGDTRKVDGKHVEYRYLPRELFGQIPLYHYGDKTALIVFSEDNVEIFLINHPSVTSYFKNRFLYMWEQLVK